MKLPVLTIQHIECEGPGIIASSLRAAGIGLQILHPYAGDPVPDHLEGFGGLLILGGPMNADDLTTHPFLEAERALIRSAIQSGIPVLGICLGAQLIARVLGAKVYKAERTEIGFKRVERNPEADGDALFGEFPEFGIVFQWHEDTFDLPLGATRLAHSVVCENQAFRWGDHVWAVQFHLEVTAPMVRSWVEAYRAELSRNPNMDSGTLLSQLRDAPRFAQLSELASPMIAGWASKVLSA